MGQHNTVCQSIHDALCYTYIDIRMIL